MKQLTIFRIVDAIAGSVAPNVRALCLKKAHRIVHVASLMTWVELKWRVLTWTCIQVLWSTYGTAVVSVSTQTPVKRNDWTYISKQLLRVVCDPLSTFSIPYRKACRVFRPWRGDCDVQLKTRMESSAECSHPDVAIELRSAHNRTAGSIQSSPVAEHRWTVARRSSTQARAMTAMSLPRGSRTA